MFCYTKKNKTRNRFERHLSIKTLKYIKNFSPIKLTDEKLIFKDTGKTFNSEDLVLVMRSNPDYDGTFIEDHI